MSEVIDIFLVFLCCAIVTGHSQIVSEDPQADATKPEYTSDQIHQIERSLLQIFGFKERPKPIRKDIVIPDYMVELYKQKMKDQDDLSMHINQKNTDSGSANTVRSYFHHDSDDGDEGSEEDWHKVRLVFNISDIPSMEYVTGAELRLFREIPTDIKDADSAVKHRIDIYEIIRPATKRTEALKRLIDTKRVDLRNAKWESFDVSETVNNWRKAKKFNNGLEVHFLTKNGDVPKSQEHVRLRRSVRRNRKNKRNKQKEDRDWNKKRPVLVMYSDDGKARSRTRRNNHRKSRNLRRKSRDQCRRHQLYVDFSDVGWNDWIVAPPGYQAYYCHGDCPFPLADHLNSTNHAIVQNLVNSAYPHVVPKACCVPTELSPISMLYLDENEKVVLKNYQDMVVEGCGCR